MFWAWSMQKGGPDQLVLDVFGCSERVGDVLRKNAGAGVQVHNHYIYIHCNCGITDASKTRKEATRDVKSLATRGQHRPSDASCDCW